MNIIHTEQFQHEGKNYEIRLYGSGWDFTVEAYLDSKRANGYSYSVSLPTAIDLQRVHGLDSIKLLVEHAKRDIANKVWEKYVEAYVACLKKTPEQSLGCRKCSTRDILVSTVDQRKMYECKKCGNVWYETRTVTGGFLPIIDDITEGVEGNGFHEIDTSILLNTVFRQHDKGLSFNDQLRNWASQNKLKYEVFSRGKNQILKFWR